jgi:hypothetical protein
MSSTPWAAKVRAAALRFSGLRCAFENRGSMPRAPASSWLVTVVPAARPPDSEPIGEKPSGCADAAVPGASLAALAGRVVLVETFLPGGISPPRD